MKAGDVGFFGNVDWVEEGVALRLGGGRHFEPYPQSDGVPPTMITEEGLKSMARRIMALGYSREDAGILAASIGGRRFIDADTGNLTAWYPDGRSVLLPRTVMSVDSDEEG